MFPKCQQDTVHLLNIQSLLLVEIDHGVVQGQRSPVLVQTDEVGVLQFAH